MRQTITSPGETRHQASVPRGIDKILNSRFHIIASIEDFVLQSASPINDASTGLVDIKKCFALALVLGSAHMKFQFKKFRHFRTRA
jgi:hypothetical protein